MSDETVLQDLTIKARLYARSGYARYWVVTREGVHEHTDPEGGAYGTVVLRPRGETVSLPDGTALEVERLLPQG